MNVQHVDLTGDDEDPVLTAIASHRPTESQLAQAFPRERTDRVFDRLMAELDTPAEPARRRISRRATLALVGVAATAAAAAIVVPALLPSRTPGSAATAAAMEKLAAIARADSSPVIPENQFLLVISKVSQRNRGQADDNERTERWISPDGTVVRAGPPPRPQERRRSVAMRHSPPAELNQPRRQADRTTLANEAPRRVIPWGSARCGVSLGGMYFPRSAVCAFMVLMRSQRFFYGYRIPVPVDGQR